MVFARSNEQLMLDVQMCMLISQFQFEAFYFLSALLPHSVYFERSRIWGWFRPKVDGIFTLIHLICSQSVQFLPCFGKLLFPFLPQSALILKGCLYLLACKSGRVQIILEGDESILFACQLTTCLSGFLSQLLYLSTQGSVLSEQSFVFLGDQANGVLDPHEFVVLFLDEALFGLLLLFALSMLLLHGQLCESHLIGNSLFDPKYQCFVLSCFVPAFPNSLLGLLFSSLPLRLQSNFLASGCCLLHIQKFHSRTRTCFPPLDLLCQCLLTTSQVLHQQFLLLACFVQSPRVVCLHVCSVCLKFDAPLFSYSCLYFVCFEFLESGYLLLIPSLLLSTVMTTTLHRMNPFLQCTSELQIHHRKFFLEGKG